MIALTQGQYTKVAEEHYEWLMQWLWRAQWDRDTKSFYAVRSVRKADGTWTTEYMHRLITGFLWEKVDHINHDTLNNLPSNMRDGTLHNNKNARPQGGTSQYYGVCWDKKSQKWRAQILVDGRRIYLGLYDTDLDAAIVRDEATLKYHGAHGTLNFPEMKGAGNAKG